MSEAETEVDLSISLARANLLGLPLFLILFSLVLVIYGWLWGAIPLLVSIRQFLSVKVAVPYVLVGAVVHEALHAAGWIVAARLPFSAMAFGFQVKTLTPYAHCKIPVRASAYRIGVALPAIALGVLPSAIGIAAHDAFSAVFGALFLGAACGDLLCLWIMRGVNGMLFVKDHPTKAGCIVLRVPGGSPFKT